MHKILVIILYFSIYALNVSNDISPSSGAIRNTAYKKSAPEDGLIQSETYRAYINHNNFVHLVGLFTYTVSSLGSLPIFPSDIIIIRVRNKTWNTFFI
jgi:hypothetical protein